MGPWVEFPEAVRLSLLVDYICIFPPEGVVGVINVLDTNVGVGYRSKVYSGARKYCDGALSLINGRGVVAVI
jgi:hypothetical protein